VPLTDSNVIQSAQGTTGASADFNPVTVTLSTPTSGGTVLIGITCDETIPTDPSGFVRDANVVSGAHSHAIFRKQASVGETSWNVTMSAVGMAAWWVWEVTGLDPSPVDVTSSGAFSTATTKSTGTTSTTTVTDLLLVASWASWNSSNLTVTWSGQTNSFTEINDVATANTGSTEVSIASARRFPGATSSFETTATASASSLISALVVGYKALGPPPATIAQVPIGSSFALTATVTARSSSTSLDLSTVGTTVQGSIAVDGALAVTGTMARALDQIPVTVTASAFVVGDVVQSNVTGEAMVVREVWTDAAGPHWSNTTNRSTQYSTSGWSVIGSASLA
jgi:hypothetical protein